MVICYSGRRKPVQGLRVSGISKLKPVDDEAFAKQKGRQVAHWLEGTACRSEGTWYASGTLRSPPKMEYESER